MKSARTAALVAHGSQEKAMPATLNALPVGTLPVRRDLTRRTLASVWKG